MFGLLVSSRQSSFDFTTSNREKMLITKPKTPTRCEQRQTNKQKYIGADLLSWLVLIRMVPCEKYISLLISWNLYTHCVETPTRSYLAGVRLMNFSIREWSEVKKLYLSFLVLSNHFTINYLFYLKPLLKNLIYMKKYLYLKLN